MYFHSSSERSVGQGFLMRARVPNPQQPTAPFHTVSLGNTVNRGTLFAKVLGDSTDTLLPEGAWV